MTSFCLFFFSFVGFSVFAEEYCGRVCHLSSNLLLLSFVLGWLISLDFFFRCEISTDLTGLEFKSHFFITIFFSWSSVGGAGENKKLLMRGNDRCAGIRNKENRVRALVEWTVAVWFGEVVV